MLNGVLIYTEYEANRNRFFIDELLDAAKKSSINLKLVIFEKTEFDFTDNDIDIFYDNNHIKEVDFAILRMMNYTLALNFEKCGIRVFNNSFVSKITDNKYLTYQEMKKNDVPVLNTVFQYDVNVSDVFYPNVTKPIDSKGGDRVFLNKDFNDLNKSISCYKECNYILQEVADDVGKDLRVYVIGDEIVTSILRSAREGIISNYCKGGVPSKYNLDAAQKKLVKKIIDVLKPDYVGIDFLFCKEGIVLNEIENVVGARMVYKLTDINIAREFVNYVKEQMDKK